MLIYVSIFLLRFGSSSPRTEVTIASLATFTFSLKVIKEVSEDTRSEATVHC